MAKERILVLLEKKRELVKEMVYIDKQIEKLLKGEEKPESKAETVSEIHYSYLEEKVTKLIIELGIPAHIKGYHYIRKAVIMVVEDVSLIDAVTKKLYPSVAKIYSTTPQRVERAIRHAIEVGFKKKRDKWKNCISLEVQPTNSEFIATVADKLRKSK